MDKFFVTIAGNRFQAARAAADRGIGLAFNRDYRLRNDLAWPMQNVWRTTGYVGKQFAPELNAWHNENVDAKAIETTGALLCFHSI